MIYIVMGVSGSGKSTIGGRLSQALDVPFYDADDFHPPANIAKMQGGTPLNDDDRRPWLEAIAAEMVKWHAQGDAVLACSALKEAYRTVLEESGVPCQWIFLTGTEQVLAKRLASRKDHFFNIDLLKSQLDTLEAPVEAWKFNIENSVESIVTGIINRTQEEHLKQDIGVVGLGVMGRNLVLNFAENDTSVAAYNRHVEGKEENVARDFVSSNPEFSNIAPFDDLGQFVSSLKEPRNILIMVQAGAAVDAVIDQLRPMLKAGDSIIDGGNSHYLDTVRREEALANDGIDFIGMGVSGGEKGARFGPSMMPGGAPTSVERNLEFFKKVSAKDKHGLPCCANIGTGGAGHFVKMIHNGIEYAEMELIAECYTLLKELGGMSKDEIAAVFESWQEGALESYLLGITIEILRAKNEKQHKLDSVQDYASHKGTGSWSVRAALDLYVAGDTIASALAARQYSSSRSLRHELAEKYQRQGQSNETDIESFIRELRNAYSAARVINHVIGFEIIKAASDKWSWSIDLPELARIWTNGCIIRSQLMVDFIEIHRSGPGSHLLMNDAVHQALSGSVPDLRSVLASAIRSGIALPTLTASITYFDAMTTAQSGAHIIAAQRDYFGAHGFYHVDDDSGQLHHWNWSMTS